MPKKDTDFSEADFKKEINKILKSMDIPLDPDGNYPEEVKELWPAIQSKLGKKLLAKNWRVWTTMWTNVIGPTYVSAAKEAAKYAGVKYTGEIGAFAKKYHRDHGLQLCKTLTETDLQRVQDQIVDNWGIGEKAFEKKFQDDYIGSEARLKTIYRSEHARAISEGTLEVGQEVGHTYKQWWCSEDERSCEICRVHHEETVPMDEAFSGGFAIPQDSHPSCRCVLITLEESDLSDDQKARMASRDPISLDDLDPTFRDSPWKSNEAFRQVLNYKCEFNGTDWKCPDSIPNDTSNEVHNGKHNTLKGSLTNINDIKKPYLEASGKLFEEWGSGPMLEWDPDNIPDKSDPLYSEYKIEEEKYSELLKQYENERKKVEELAPPIHNGALWAYHRNSYAFNKPEEMKTEKEKHDTKLLEETLNVIETKLPIVLWRGEHKDKWDQLARSKNLETDEFVSLTEERGIAEQFKDSKGTHLIRWELPPKSHAFPIWNQVGNLENVHEREWVLNKGSKIEVTGKFGNILNVKVIPDNKKQNSVKLNYKCPENSHGPGFGCGEGEPTENSDIKSPHDSVNAHYTGFDVSFDFEDISDKNSVLSDKIQQTLKDEAHTVAILSNDERDVIKTYTLMGYSVNEYLYKHPQLTDQKYKGEIKTIETFDNIFKNNKLKNSIITFRGISKKTLNKDKYLYDALHVPGTEIKLNGYSSSSIMPFVAAQLASVDNGCILEMKLPKGSDALYIAKESTFPWEEEVLINRNTNIKIGSSRVERVMIEPGNFKDMEIISVELKPSTNIKRKQNSNDFLKAAVQSAFEIALKIDASKIKFNWNCKDSEKNGTGPGSCKDATDSNTKSKNTTKNPKSSPKPVKVGTYAKIYANKSPKAFPNQLYIVRMGEEDESQYNTKGNQFYGTNLDQLIQKALDSSKDSGRLIIGRVSKDKLDDNDLKDALNNNLEINPGYLSSMVAPVDTVIDTASGDTVYKRSQEKLDEEHAKYIESEEFDKQLNQNTAISEYRNFGYQSINTVLRGSYVTDKSQKTSTMDSRDVISEDVVIKTKERIAHIHEAMMPLPKGTTLYRVDGSALTATLFESLGITKELNAKFSESGNNRPKTEDVQQNAAYWNKYLTDKLKDSEFQDLGFSSTSKGRAHISNDLLVPTTELSPYGMPSLLEISTPKGTRSIDVQERIGVGEGRYKEEKEVILDSGTKFKVKSVEFKFRGNEMYTHIKVDALQDQIEEKQNSIQKITQTAFETALKLGINKIKFNANCPESEKVGTGPGSCGGKTLENPLYSSLSKKSQATMKKYKMKGELKKVKTSIMASLVKSTKDEKSALENAKINASIFKGMTAEEADELTGDAAQEHTNWFMDKGAYYDIKQGISEPMLEDTEELHKRGWNVNGTYHPDIPKKSILDDAAAKIFTYKDEQGRFHKNAELIDAVEEYTGDLYDMYNKVSAGNLPPEFLKLTPEDQKELKDRIDNFAAALNTAELPEPVVTYRGIRETTLKRLEQLGASEIGSEFQVNYFQSTTLNYETTKSFMGKDSKGRSLRIQIKLPKGTSAAYVDGFSANNGEDEVLVNRNLKYRCVDVKETDATKTLVWEALL